MIPGFEELTEELSQEEVKMARKIVQAFLARGQDNPITSTQIIKKMSVNGYSMNGPRLRKIIQYIRTRQLIRWLPAAGNGYEWTTKPEKIRKYKDSLLKRENSMKATRTSFPNL